MAATKVSISSLVKADLQKLALPKKAKACARFFKTGKGEYGEGDKFLGVTVPEQRSVVKQYWSTITLDPDIIELIQSDYHEHRLTGLLFLVEKFSRSKENKDREEYFKFYVDHMKWVNNWDLVDCSAPKIVGAWLINKPKEERTLLYDLAKSDDLWERRISIISTQTFIKNREYDDTLAIAKILLRDKHDLIHKAVGWMLREIGNKNQSVEEQFLDEFYTEMPRTMLRYAIEKFSSAKKQHYMKKD